MKTSHVSQPALDEGACIFGAGVLLKHLQALEAETGGVRSGHEDIEFIHRARVASRRLRASLPLFASCLPDRKVKAWLKEIRAVTRALGAARDADVQIERLEAFYQGLAEERFKPGVHRLTLRLRQKRQSLQPAVTAAMDHLLESQLFDSMHARLDEQAAKAETTQYQTYALYQHSSRSIQARLEEFMSYEPIIALPEKMSELHEMRIAAKRLRYTMENFAPLYSSNLKNPLQAVRKAQDLLGDIHDCDVWLAFLPLFLEEERQRVQAYFGHSRPYSRLVSGIRRFEKDRSAARADLFIIFNREWAEWKRKGTWEKLRATIQLPFPSPQQVYPTTSPLFPSEPKEGNS